MPQPNNNRRIPLDPSLFGLDPAGKQIRMKRIADTIVAWWAAEARGAGLNTTLQPYIHSIAIREVSDNHCTVELPGKNASRHMSMLASMVEFGMGPGGIGTEGDYDVRKFLLRGGTRNIKFGRSGPYVNVPFHQTKKSVEAEFGKSAVAALGRLTGTGVGKQGMQQGGKYKTTAKPGSNKITGLPHKAHKLASAVRQISAYSNVRSKKVTVQTSGYQTFRRASWAGDPWQHPGIKARHLAEKVRKKMPEILAEAL